MVVCVCRNITERDVAEAVCNGASCIKDINKCFGGPNTCGKCGPYIKEIIKEEK